MSDNENPWLVQSLQDVSPGCQTCDAADRIRKIRESTDVAWIGRVLRWPDNQATVLAAAASRLRKLTARTKH